VCTGSASFKDTFGSLLQGNGVSASNFVTSFSVNNSTNVVVSVPSFARGPNAFANINVPNNTANGIPIFLSTGAGVTSATLTLTYEPGLLTGTAGGVLGAAVNPALAGATLTVDPASTPGRVILHFSSPTPLASGQIRLGGLLARVPNNA